MTDNAYDFISDMYHMAHYSMVSELLHRSIQHLQAREDRDLYERIREVYEDVSRRESRLSTALQTQVHKYMPGYEAYGAWSGNPPEEVLVAVLAKAREKYSEASTEGKV